MTCAYCGEFIGDGRDNPREPAACENPECQHEVRDMYRQMEAEARERAAGGKYGAY